MRPSGFVAGERFGVVSGASRRCAGKAQAGYLRGRSNTGFGVGKVRYVENAQAVFEAIDLV